MKKQLRARLCWRRRCVEPAGLRKAAKAALLELDQDGPAWGPLRAALIRDGVRGI